MRDRLVELIDKADEECKHSKSCKACSGYGKGSMCMNYHIADYLLANGVIVLPCNVGDTIYFETYRCGESTGVQPHNVAKINVVVTIERPFGSVGAEIPDWQFGKYVFLTREEAEKALEERNEKGGEE